MTDSDRKFSRSRISNALKAEIVRKHLFNGLSAKKLSEEYAVSRSAITRWKAQARENLEAVYSSESDKIKLLCSELTSLKKELGEL